MSDDLPDHRTSWSSCWGFVTAKIIKKIADNSGGRDNSWAGTQPWKHRSELRQHWLHSLSRCLHETTRSSHHLYPQHRYVHHDLPHLLTAIVVPVGERQEEQQTDGVLPGLELGMKRMTTCRPSTIHFQDGTRPPGDTPMITMRHH
jgi:hypothetical protein